MGYSVIPIDQDRMPNVSFLCGSFDLKQKVWWICYTYLTFFGNGHKIQRASSS